MSKLKKLYFKSRTFFLTDFPFSIIRMSHKPEDYNESVRCKREFWKIIYVINGQGWKVINNRKYPIKPGSLFLIHPDDETTFSIESKNIDIYNIVFMPELVMDEIKNLRSEYSFFSILGNDFHDSSGEYRELLYVLDSSREIVKVIKKMELEFKKEAPNYRNMIKLYLQELLILASRQSRIKVSADRQKNIVHYIDHMIETHFAEEFNLDKLASQMNVSKNHLCRIYKKITGTTIMKTLLKTRLNHAVKMLKQHDANITEICYRCGFNNLSYFYRAFTSEYGLNPGNYRKSFALD